MGCFLGCFNSSKDHKPRKRRYKAVTRDQNPKSQNLVQADVSLVQSIKDKPSDSLPELRGKNEEPLSLSTRKKVTFDTNVTTYEPVQVYDSTESLLEKNEKGETIHSHSGSPEGSNSPNGGSYPPNYRYGNCLESDDEFEVSDYENENEDGLDDEEDYDDKDEDEDGTICQDVWCESIQVPISDSKTESCLSPVLKPVENLSQWKMMKSNGTGTLTQPLKPSSFDPQKENFSFNSIPFTSKFQNQETAVEASLNWMITPEKTSTNNKRVGSCNPDFEPISSGKSFSQESTVTSVKSIEDRPILGALTAEELKQFSDMSCTPRKSPGKSPDDMPIIGSVGSYWSHTSSAQSLSPTSSYKGIPNATNKYREDKKVNWQNIPFETRLERALSGDVADC